MCGSGRRFTFVEKLIFMDLRKYVSERNLFEEALKDFKQKYRRNPDLSMSEYCAQERLNYYRYTRWVHGKGYKSMAQLKEEALSEGDEGESQSLSDNVSGLSSILPLSPSMQYSYNDALRRAEVVMPNGTHVLIQDFSVEELAVLLMRCSEDVNKRKG